jgi:hypothetical protein
VTGGEKGGVVGGERVDGVVAVGRGGWVGEGKGGGVGVGVGVGR